jgi:hypothetical protein
VVATAAVKGRRRLRRSEVGKLSYESESSSSSTDSTDSTDLLYSSASSTRAKKKKTYSSSSLPQEQMQQPTPKKNDDLETRKLPPRECRKRVLPDMISHDDIDLMRKRRKEEEAAAVVVKEPRVARLSVVSSSSSTSSTTPDGENNSGSSLDSNSDSDSDLDSEHEEEEAEDEEDDEEDDDDEERKSIRPPPVKKQKSTAAPRVEKPKKREWQMEEVDAYCHQCRRKTFYAKMTCSDCQKKFCVRCYAFRCVPFFFGVVYYNVEAEFIFCLLSLSFFFSRYPECEFDANDEEYSCPACEGFCNCTACFR